MGSRAEAGKGKARDSFTVDCQNALLKVDLDSADNPYLFLQQGGAERSEFQERPSNICGSQRIKINADFNFGVESSVVPCSERCCLHRFLHRIQWILWPPDGLDYAEAGPNCSSSSCSNLGVPPRWIPRPNHLPQESCYQHQRQYQCHCLSISVHCHFNQRNHHHRDEVDSGASSQGTIGV